MRWNTTTSSSLCKNLNCGKEYVASTNNTLRSLYGSSYPPVREFGQVDPRKYIALPFKIATGGEWPNVKSNYWSKQKKMEEKLKIMSNVVELIVSWNGSTMVEPLRTAEMGVIENLSVDHSAYREHAGLLFYCWFCCWFHVSCLDVYGQIDTAQGSIVSWESMFVWGMDAHCSLLTRLGKDVLK